MTNTIADYNIYLVALSYAVAVAGSLSGLFVATQIRNDDGTLNMGWLTWAAALIGGCAIWAMHFLGMIAYNPGGPVSYDTNLTFVSLVVPIFFVFFGLYVAFRWPESFAARAGAGAVTGLGVAAMHYTGMTAMRVAATMSYDMTLVAASVVIAVLAAIAALHIMVKFTGAVRYASALVMGVAVTGMHYTGMAAMRIQAADIQVNYFEGALTERVTGIVVVAMVVAVCTIAALLAANRLANDTAVAATEGLDR